MNNKAKDGPQNTMPNVGDVPPEMSPEEALIAMQSTLTCIIAMTRSPSDALCIALESTLQIAVAFGVDLRHLSAWLMRAQENKPPTAEHRADARALIDSCMRKARRVMTMSEDIAGQLKQKRAEQLPPGCAAHRTRRPDCHDCAMNQPPPTEETSNG